MTKYEEARIINRAVKKSLKRQLGEPVIFVEDLLIYLLM